MSVATERALIARGWSTERAAWAASSGLTLNGMRKSERQVLEKNGLSDPEIDSLRKGARPPIPQQTVIKLLHESKRTCCICRVPTKSVVIHHIEKWSLSRDHSESNLVVLCLDHHDEAHTKRELSINLTQDHIRSHKEQWLEQVKHSDAKAVLRLASVEDANWGFINHNRLFELADRARLKPAHHRFYDELKNWGLLHSSGRLVPHNKWPDNKPTFWLYDIAEGQWLYVYTSSVLEAVLKQLPIIDLSNRWTKREITALVEPGSWIALQAAYYFRRQNRLHRGRNQARRGLRRGTGISIEFFFDAWEATSSSAQSLHLSGHQVATCILLVKSISRTTDNKVTIKASCLAIGSYFKDERKHVNKRPPQSHHLNLSDLEDGGYLDH